MVENLIIKSVRGTDIHCTKVTGKENNALMVFVHGFCAERTEGGRFVTVAEELAKHGICSIMMDQSGCGQSGEPFDQYCMDNSFDDISACVDYMLANYPIDTTRMGMVGYSMGGRITSVYVTQKDTRFRTIGLWAAAINHIDRLYQFCYDSEENRDLVKEAEERGYAEYNNVFDGRRLHLSQKFYQGMFGYDPVECMKQFDGNVIICQGLADDTVVPETAQQCYDNLTTQGARKLVMIEGANHGFGLWDDHMEQSAILTDSTAQFILKNL